MVDLWERLAADGIDVDLGSDQTSLHNPWAGGYYPVGLTYEESGRMMAEEPERFKERVQESLRRQVDAINRLASRGMYFFDYGNAFLLESSRAGADVMAADGRGFRYPSYVQDIMGPMFFDYGFGPFRWVCSSGKAEDLAVTDRLAAEVLEEMLAEAPDEIRGQLPDVAGTDSPFRETSNIYDGSSFTADMAVHNVIGDSFRGATWVSIHNGGGVGWGEVINGGFGMVIDGSAESQRHIEEMLLWDVNNGIARRSWARNEGAISAVRRQMAKTPGLTVTLPSIASDEVIEQAFENI